MESMNKTKKSSNGQMFASFQLGRSELALSIFSLQEVVNYPEKVTKVPLAPDYLVGLFNLRGRVTPIVDMGSLLGIETEPSCTHKKVAIAHLGDVRIGLLFDTTSEILHVLPEDISSFDLPPEGRRSVVQSVLKLDGGDRIIEVISPEALLKVENIPQILAQNPSLHEENLRRNSKRGQCITIRSGELEFGLQISAIREIIRVPEIKKSVLAVDYCIGMVNLRGMIVPILDFQKFLKIGGEISNDVEAKRIVVLRLEEIQVGLLVDSVDNIVTFFEEEILPIPMFRQDKIEMMRGLLSLKDRSNIILLNESKILSNDEVLEITRGHDSLYGQVEKKSQTTLAKTTERRPYLSFRLNYALSTRLSDIDEIAKVDEELLRPPGYPDYVVGMMKMRGEIVTVIDLRCYYGMKQSEDSSSSRVLIIKGQQAKYGLLVDSVESIDTVDEANKVKMPNMLASDVAATLQGDMKEIVEMTDATGMKKTFMILNVPELLGKLEAQAA